MPECSLCMFEYSLYIFEYSLSDTCFHCALEAIILDYTKQKFCVSELCMDYKDEELL